MSSFDPATRTHWLAPEDLDLVRDRVPMVYVQAVPVRLDDAGQVTHVGLLLRVLPDGTISRAVVAGRVLYGETVRQALLRHLAKDVGPAARPRLPPQPAPFTVAEYFPHPEVTGFHDPRQHAVSLVYVVPIEGECLPADDALEFSWLTPEEVVSSTGQQELSGDQGRLVRMALASVGRLA
jgi:ADP-ribose pyrophosphatase YjhB (NUDIX family)